MCCCLLLTVDACEKEEIVTTTERDEDDDDVYVDVKPIVVIPADVGGLPSPNTPGSQYDQKTFLHGIHLPQLGDRGTYART